MKNRVIIADDEPITRMDISEMLIEAGYDVVGQANDGFDAVELCRKHKPDLVVLDVKMPLLDGLKAAKIIRSEYLAGCIVLATAYSGKEFIEEAKEAGAMGYFVKPIDEKTFLATLEIVRERSKDFEKVQCEVAKANEELENRKLIERAKGIFMKNNDISEKEAYDRIRKLSMNKRCSMKDIAYAIVAND